MREATTASGVDTRLPDWQTPGLNGDYFTLRES